ncbi:MAG: lycopene cyclase protein [Bacteroidetes bacterium]|nr:lycopene cyclase protein [Bacteroidota bacterium]
MKPYTYLLVEFFTIVVCFIYSFDKRIQFHKHFGSFLKASFCVAIPFIAWDVWFTSHGVWWFDTGYTVGISLLGLPIEEWLFFFCIPFSCVFTYFCLDKFFRLDWANRYTSLVVWFTLLVCLQVAIIFYDRAYTLVTALATLSIIVFLRFIAKVDWIGKASFVFLILMLGFFPVNGVLTGTGIESPVVNYDPNEILNVRMLTIPIEDAVYGYAQFLLVVYFFYLFKKRSKQASA